MATVGGARCGLDVQTTAGAIDYLREENRVLREKLGKKRVWLNDDQRRRLAAKAKVLGRRLLSEVCSIVKPDTILRWHRQLIALKYDGSDKRRLGRPGVMSQIRRLIRIAIDPKAGAML
ncbi:MAG: hypothetical protein IIB99_06495 [Planctomycetes bacterium]|nr:hypothetical protein [Planctomycetota bacterium]